VIAQTLPNPWDESTDYFVPFAAELDASKPTNADSLRQALLIVVMKATLSDITR